MRDVTCQLTCCKYACHVAKLRESGAAACERHSRGINAINPWCLSPAFLLLSSNTTHAPDAARSYLAKNMHPVHVNRLLWDPCVCSQTPVCLLHLVQITLINARLVHLSVLAPSRLTPSAAFHTCSHTCTLCMLIGCSGIPAHAASRLCASSVKSR